MNRILLCMTVTLVGVPELALGQVRVREQARPQRVRETARPQVLPRLKASAPHARVKLRDLVPFSHKPSPASVRLSPSRRREGSATLRWFGASSKWHPNGLEEVNLGERLHISYVEDRRHRHGLLLRCTFGSKGRMVWLDTYRQGRSGGQKHLGVKKSEPGKLVVYIEPVAKNVRADTNVLFVLTAISGAIDLRSCRVDRQRP